MTNQNQQTISYSSLNTYLKETFGSKVYKLSFDLGLSCPNRDGTLDNRGCIFCSGQESFTQKLSINTFEKEFELKIENAKSLVKNKVKSAKYIAYFQSYTNTYAPAELLEPIFNKAIQNQEIVAISIATRPDCLGEDILAMLERLNKIKPVWIDLGLQTIHQQTADFIRRKYPLETFETAVNNLNKIGVKIITHLILGLPNESCDMMLESAKYIANSKIHGVKFHLLHILKNTDLERLYHKGAIKTLSINEYFEILSKCLEILPQEIIIHRLTGDGAKSELIAPMWSANKKNVLNQMNNYFKTNKVQQGKHYKKKKESANVDS